MLSCRDQDKPKEGDARLLFRERRLLNPINVNKIFIDGLPLAEGREVFVNKDLQELWNQALKTDHNYVKIVEAVRNNERGWPKDLKIQIEGSEEPKPLKAMIAACSFENETGILYYQGRIWVPQFEPLTTGIIRNIHDAAVSGHPGGDATLAQVARGYLWPGISKAIKR